MRVFLLAKLKLHTHKVEIIRLVPSDAHKVEDLMQDYKFQFELGQVVMSAFGPLTVLGRTRYMCPESYLVVVDDEQMWLLATDLSPLN